MVAAAEKPLECHKSVTVANKRFSCPFHEAKEKKPSQSQNLAALVGSTLLPNGSFFCVCGGQ